MNLSGEKLMKLTLYESKKLRSLTFILKETKMKARQIAKRLGISVKTVRRYKKELQDTPVINENGTRILCIQHKNKYKPNQRRIDDAVFEEIGKKYFEICKDQESRRNSELVISFSDFYYEYVKDFYPISRSTFYKRMLEQGFCSAFANKKTLRKAKRNLNIKILEKKCKF
ncbi:helix-turn-helix domain-containing protein [Mycoplasmopsis caviae]|uniref:Helix-turn-helix domain-containing protein n=1 Tax=Mycoplasmopsis caviae TaxID=55603 RepID=A0A3P8LB24_9BACT|nr:helix-turn-helix domain-containing protein [Mycoplasmopsis caviae]UUD35002.1 helix-turn-helix domain-containing protein [Mycoplasmopsis caviae]VDR42171.1 Uncharacterised protein [Mycoplasmopsis caviae]